MLPASNGVKTKYERGEMTATLYFLGDNRLDRTKPERHGQREEGELRERVGRQPAHPEPRMTTCSRESILLSKSLADV